MGGSVSLQKDEEESRAKVKKFDRLLRIYEPSSLSPNVLQEIWEECHDKLYMALSEMVDSIERLSITHEQELGSYVVDVWKQRITDGQSEFDNFINIVGIKVEPPQKVSPDAVAEVTEIALMQVKVNTEGDHAKATRDKTSDEVNLYDATKDEASGDEVSYDDATTDDLAVATTSHVPAAVEGKGDVREDQEGCGGKDWMLLMGILRKFRTVSKPQMSLMNLWGGASRMTLCLTPTPLLLLQLMVFLQMLVDVDDAFFSGASRAAKVSVMYGEEHKFSYTYESVLLGEPEYPVLMIGVSQDVSYGVPYYEVPFDMVLSALRIGSDMKVEEDNLLPKFSIDFLVAALAVPRLLSR